MSAEIYNHNLCRELVSGQYFSNCRKSARLLAAFDKLDISVRISASFRPVMMRGVDSRGKLAPFSKVSQ